MNIDQVTFETIVADMARQLDANHGQHDPDAGSNLVALRRLPLDRSAVGEALLNALGASGISVGAEAEGARAARFLNQNGARLGVNAEIDGDAVRLTRVQ
ncbi:hypothetical protein [Paraburkholderia youngii]|uniref:hypothetical protein n=1 Tax=Paraburkholderia youngii TaxID=2782701 RepID=UPI003D191FA3